ncbi:MAG TPA: hypothetical protein VIN93_14510 [Bryobacteraceae bacterium]|jgi:hypothetical protein
MPGPLRRLLPLLSVLLLAAVAYDGWIFYSRWQWRRDAAVARAAAEEERDRKAIDALGGGGLQIRDFYAVPTAIHRGERASICYSVFGAATLRLDPPAANVYPALSHCVQVSPRQSTEFKLAATDSAGHTVTAKLVLRVAR